MSAAVLLIVAAEITNRQRRASLGRGEDFVPAKVGQEQAFGAIGRRMGEAVKAEVAPLEPVFQ